MPSWFPPSLALRFVIAGTALAAPTAVAAQQVPAATWTVGATGNSAQYRVREQLAGVEFENDAVGVTTELSGAIVFDADGQVIPDSSRIVIGLRSLTSDKSRRDGYLQRRTLDTEAHPTATLLVTGFEGLPHPLPTAGEVRFTLLGALTLKGRTIPTRWQAAATFADGHVTGSATTQLTFVEAGLDKPSVMAVLSVRDSIGLEVRFHLIASQ